MHEVLNHRRARQPSATQERQNAHAYWEGRKAELGITRDMPMGEKLQCLSAARAHTVRHAPARPGLHARRAQERALAQSVRGLARHVAALQRYARREERIEQRREPRTWQQELAAERGLAAGKAHGLPRDRHAEQMVARLERTARTSDVAQRLRGLA